MSSQLRFPYSILFVLFFVLNCVILSAQTEFPVILNYENSSGEKGISWFEYDGNQKMIKGRWQLLDNSRWSNNFYRYNELGQLVEKYREFSDSITSSLKYEYDEKGRKTAEDFSRSDGIAGKSVFEYNGAGALVKINCNKYNGWFDGEIDYQPNEKGEPKSGEIFRDGKKLGDIVFEYFENGNLKMEKWITTGWSQTFDWEYIPLPKSYTSSNVFIGENNRFRLTEENYSYNGETGGPSFFKYEKKGQLIEKIFVRSDSLKTTTSFEYDENGILKKSLRKYNDGSTATFIYTFNKNRKLTHRSFTHSNGTNGDEEYFYSKTGELEKAVWKNFDNWLTGEITFEHAKNGTIKKGTFTGEKFNATIDFGYDEYGNLNSVLWNFSFGETQKYSFSYTDLYHK